MKKVGLVSTILFLNLVGLAQLPNKLKIGIAPKEHLNYGLLRCVEAPGPKRDTFHSLCLARFGNTSTLFRQKNSHPEIFYLSDDSEEVCERGRMDAVFHGKETQHFLLGFLLPVPGIVAVLCTNYKPENARPRATEIMEMNYGYFNDETYRKCYNRKAKKRMLGKTALGASCAITIGFLVGILIEDTIGTM